MQTFMNRNSGNGILALNLKSQISVVQSWALMFCANKTDLAFPCSFFQERIIKTRKGNAETKKTRLASCPK